MIKIIINHDAKIYTYLVVQNIICITLYLILISTLISFKCFLFHFSSRGGVAVKVLIHYQVGGAIIVCDFK